MKRACCPIFLIEYKSGGDQPLFAVVVNGKINLFFLIIAVVHKFHKNCVKKCEENNPIC
jgi:hypothetical protein